MKKALLFVVAIICIISAVFLVAQGNLLSGISQSAHRQESSNPFEEPPELEKEINSIDDILEDLTSLGCRLINVTREGTRLESILAVNNYSDFRWIAYNTKLVFIWTGIEAHYTTQQGSGIEYGIYCFTLYQGFPIGFQKTFRTPTFTQTPAAVLVLENVRFYSTDSIRNRTEMVLRNTGTADAKIAAIYWSKTSYDNLSKLLDSEFTLDPNTGIVSAESSIKIIIKWGVSGGTVTDPEWTSGSKYYFKVVTEDGKYIEFVARAP